jgi:hypothetical protein
MLLRGSARQRLEALDPRSRGKGCGYEAREAPADFIERRRDERSTTLAEATLARFELPLDRGLDAGCTAAVSHHHGLQQV